MRILLLLVVGLIFLTGVVWWVLFIANAITRSMRKR